MSNPSLPPLRIINVVWGEAFTRAFLEYSLPSQLSPNNLPYLGDNADVSYCIYSTREDIELMQRSVAIHRVSEYMRMEFFVIAETRAEARAWGGSTRYNVMNACHSEHIQISNQRGAGSVFMGPDVIVADGAFQSLLDMIQCGHRVILICGLRANKPLLLNAIQQSCFDQLREMTLTISPRELVRLLCDHLHPETENLIWDSTRSSLWPSYLIWRVAGEGLLLHAFHLHPFYVLPERDNVVPTTTIDDRYLEEACPDTSQYSIVSDSDQLFLVEFSDPGHMTDTYRDRSVSTAEVAQWMSTYTTELHRKYVQQSIRIHHTAPTEPAWQSAECQAASAVREILMGLEQGTAHAS